MPRWCLALTLWLVAPHALAQGPALDAPGPVLEPAPPSQEPPSQEPALAEPGPVLADPYRACEGCTDARVWHDPYAAELTRLERERPGRFGPIALLVGGTLFTVAGFGMLVDSAEASYPSDDRAAGGLSIVAGAAAVTVGAIWHKRRKLERARIDARIHELQLARGVALTARTRETDRVHYELVSVFPTVVRW